MNIDNQKNGNNQVNSIRNDFNDRTKKKLFLGNSNEFDNFGDISTLLNPEVVDEIISAYKN